MMVLSLVAFLLGFSPSLVAAAETGPFLAWESQGVPISVEPGIQRDVEAMADGSGGVIYAWKQVEGVRVQRTDARGLKLWPDAGVLVGDSPPSPFNHFMQGSPVLTSDLDGGALVAWVQTVTTLDHGSYQYVLMQRISHSGERLWGDAGIQPAIGFTPASLRIAPDGSGGAIIVWSELRDGYRMSVWAQRMTASGNPMWGPNGALVASGDSSTPEIAPDGVGGAYVVCYQYAGDSGLYVHRIGPDGKLHWDVAGVRLSYGIEQKIVSDGTGGAVVSWLQGYNTSKDHYTQVRVQRVGPDGAIGWAPGGIIVTPGDGHREPPRLVGDGQGGAIVVWYDQRAVPTDVPSPGRSRVQRLAADGSFFWESGGVFVSTEGTRWPDVVSDGAGGAVVVAQGMHNGYISDTGPALFAQRVDETGTPRWGDRGFELFTRIDIGSMSQGRLVADDAGGFVVFWKDQPGTTGDDTDVRAQRIVESPFSRPPILRVGRAGNGRGIVVSDDRSIECGDRCNAPYELPTTVTLRAISFPGFRFVEWDGPCGVSPTCVVGIDEDQALTATFVRVGVNLTVFRPSTGRWYVDYSANGQFDGCAIDVCTPAFGLKGDVPVVGDWTGSGMATIGVYRPSNRYWFLDLNGNSAWDGCAVDACVGPLGASGDIPVVGDWLGIGVTLIGVFRPSTGMWYLDADGDGRHSGCGTADYCMGPFGLPGDVPVLGDWGRWGYDQIGVYRPSTGMWYLDGSVGFSWWEGCDVDICLGPFGIKGDVPVVGDWAGDGKKRIGVFRPKGGYWFLDSNGNGRWDGVTTDAARGPYGLATDKPLTIPW